MINLGNIEIADLRLGASQVKALCLGSEQVWSGEEPGPVADWLRFDILADDTSIDIVNDSGTLEAPDLEFSVDDGATWTQWVPGTDYPQHEMAGAVVYVRAGATGNTGFANPNNSNAYWHFTSDDLFSVSGNIMYLLSRDGSTGLSNYCFYKLFTGCTMLVDASGLKLPATTLADHCYASMFSGCSSLTSAPVKLPAMTLASSCYQDMLKDCTSLTSAPVLPATTLASNCYSGMFNTCQNLRTAPALPATTLANNCYASMFSFCFNLTAAPALPATTLASSCYASMFSYCQFTSAPALPATTLAGRCYQSMFSYCSKLTAVPALPATTFAFACCQSMFSYCTSLSSVEVAFTAWPSNGATDRWLDNVAASGTFTCPEELPDTRGASNIPTGWLKQEPQEPVDTPLTFTATQANSTVKLNKVGSPRAISLETSTDGSTWTDYSWSGNTGDTLTLANVGDKVYMRAKTENQTISNNSDYYYQFVMTGKIAASGNIQTLLKADGSRTDAPANCYQYMFQDCSSLTTAPALPATTLADYCYLGIFVGCSSLTTAPALPATTLAEGCYSEMLAECSSLTTAPALPATTLANYCYQSMFSGCTSLATAPALPATTLADYCYSEMFFSCSSLTSAPALPATTLADVCYQYMFNSCTSLSSVAVSFTEWDTMTDATSYWLDGVAASGTFTCPRTLPDTRDESHIPIGWTKVNAA